jgi:SAM-dependent methyltransferase
VSPTGSFEDHFSAGSADYAAFRPRYPEELFDFIASLPMCRRVAWDCATGSGQAALPLAERFARVIATDASAEQLAHAERHSRVEYARALAHESGIAGGSVDLVTVAQALHWFPFHSFFGEVRRVLAPGGAIACWCYGRLTVDRAIDPVIEHYHSVTCGPYWPPERRHVEDGYANIAFPFDDIVAPGSWFIEQPMSLDRLAGYLRTWSASRRLAAAIGEDPVGTVVAELRPRWGPASSVRVVRWPLSIRAGR